MSGRGDDGSPEVSFLDTNVLVYAFDHSDRVRSPVAALLVTELLAANRLRLSVQVMQELFVTVTRKIETPLPVEEAIALMDDLAVAPVFEPRYTHVRDAALLSRAAQLSFWDAMVVVAAQASGATRLYSEDFSHGQVLLDVEISNPFLSSIGGL